MTTVFAYTNVFRGASALARENQAKANVKNVEFLKGSIEAIPLPDASVDVIISNCVINLASDKDRALREAFRVLKPAGRFAVSDVVVLGDVPDDVRRSMELWVGCVAGALQDTQYVAKLASAGFHDVHVESWRIYNSRDAADFLAAAEQVKRELTDITAEMARSNRGADQNKRQRPLQV